MNVFAWKPDIIIFFFLSRDSDVVARIEMSGISLLLSAQLQVGGPLARGQVPGRTPGEWELLGLTPKGVGIPRACPLWGVGLLWSLNPPDWLLGTHPVWSVDDLF